jgi:DNA-binding NarL/FixJ family response regulator
MDELQSADLDDLTQVDVVICDDDPVVRRALTLLLAQPDIAVLGAYPHANDCLVAIRRRPPDVALIDLNLAGRPGVGIALVQAIRLVSPSTVCLILTAVDERNQLRAQAFGAGAHGFLKKGYLSGPELPSIVRSMAAGRWEIEPVLARTVFGHACAIHGTPEQEAGPADNASREGLSLLNTVECEILRLLSAGLRPADIAGNLHIPPSGVYRHIRNITEKCHPAPSAMPITESPVGGNLSHDGLHVARRLTDAT